MSLKVASKRLQAVEVSAWQQAEQVHSAFFDLLTDSELERLIEVQARGDLAEGAALWQELLSLSPEHREQGMRVARLGWLFDMGKAISSER